MVIEIVSKFFYENFYVHHIADTGYTFFGVLIYALLFVVLAFIVYKILKKRGIDLNYKFALATIPHIIVLAALRVMGDLKLVERTGNLLDPAFYTMSPGIWIFALFFVVISFLIANFISKKFISGNYKYLIFSLFSLLLLPFVIIALTNFGQPVGALMHLIIAAALTILFIVILKKLNNAKRFNFDISNKYNKLCIGAHTFDSLLTFTSLSLLALTSYQSALDIFIRFSFVFGRVIIVIIFLYLVDMKVKSPYMNNFLKFVCFIIGLAPGLREFFLVGIQF
jgi:uncharacterized membrane protein